MIDKIFVAIRILSDEPIGDTILWAVTIICPVFVASSKIIEKRLKKIWKIDF